MSKEEAEEKFKTIQNAADHLLSRFDEESSHNSEPSHAGSDDNVQYSNVQQYFYEEYYSDDDGVTWTPSGSLFDQNAKFAVAGNILIATSRNYFAFYRFGSEPNSNPDTTHFTTIDLCRGKM